MDTSMKPFTPEQEARLREIVREELTSASQSVFETLAGRFVRLSFRRNRPS